MILKSVQDDSYYHYSLRHFFSRQRTPSDIIRDNATQFRATKSTIGRSWNDIVTDESVYDYVSTQGVKWKFIAEFSFWTGGFYKRLVDMVKSSLRKSVGSQCLTKNNYLGLEPKLNSRPLIYADEDINSANAITLNHFLSPVSKVGTPVLNNNDDNMVDQEAENFSPKREKPAETLMKIWKKGQFHLDRLWKIWYGHLWYVLSLRERYQLRIKESKKKANCKPKIGEEVHIKEDSPQSKWKLEKLEHLIQGNDGEIRAAKVRMTNGSLLKRPLILLYPME